MMNSKSTCSIVLKQISSFMVAACLLCSVQFSLAFAQENGEGAGAKALPTIESKTAGMKKLDGFFPLYWHEAAGTLWMEISRFDTEVLHMGGLAAGLGSNDIGLDRGQMGGSRIVRFERVGPKVLMVQPNYRYRASSQNVEEVRAVTDAFASSTLWGFKVVAESNGAVLVNITDFVIRDTHGISNRLRPGSYSLDKTRSAVYMPMTKGFPKNTEMEVTLTFTRKSGASGRRSRGGSFFEGVGAVAATPEAVTLRVHQSIVELPGPGYTPRAHDPRSGYNMISWRDYATPLGEPMVKRFIARHRLKKKNPEAEVSEAVEPIIYYLDRGTPEPIRSALLDGARWWNQAYEAAGYKDAFQVKMLPAGASSLDIRYNVINWTHRSTRGWSYGGSVTDPRTGEIIKGIVTLGSLRVRQDYMLAVGLLSPYKDGTETPPELAEWALARIRQLSAHEIGHTIGLGHNYYNSKLGRISVMDYPHPLVTLKSDGTLDYSTVYDVGMGEWDNVTVAWGYQDFPAGTDEKQALQKILDDAWAKDVIYMTNQDVSVSPGADQWANGDDVAAELRRMMKVRRMALNRFGIQSIKNGTPMATMEEVLVPLYMHHRFQVESAASALGGQHYIYAMRGDGRQPVKPVSADEQKAALGALLETLRADELTLPHEVVKKMPPRPSGFRGSRELFPGNTGPSFDTIAPAEVAARHTISNMLQSNRAARLVQQHVQDPNLPGLKAIIDALDSALFGQETSSGYEAEISRAIERVFVEELMHLANSAGMAQVRAVSHASLEELATRLLRQAIKANFADAAHYKLLARDINRFLNRPADHFKKPAESRTPPGAPIGDPALDWLGGIKPVCSHL